MNRTMLLVTMAALALPLAANAQTNSGPYFSVGGGVNKMQAEDVHVALAATPDATTDGQILTSAGPMLIADLGWGLRNGMRVEVEGNYRSNHISHESGLSGENGATGTERKSGVMGNALYEFDHARVRPYVGGGLGVEFVHEPDSTSSSGPAIVTVTAQTKESLAYQAIAGVAFPVRSMHGLSISAEYRYLGTVGTRTFTGTATIPGVGSFPLIDTSSDDRNHSFIAGFSYSFGG